MAEIGSEEDQQVYENRLLKTHERLTDDVLSADLQWSFLVSAQSSYRHDTVLKPFPPMFTKSSESHDNDKLDTCIRRVPSFSELIKQGFSNLDKDCSDLLLWALDSSKLKLCSCAKTKFSEIEKLTGRSTPTPAPNYVFEVQYNEIREAKWLQKLQGRKLLHAYHGSKLENFHSIIHYGLQSHLSKNALFGEGVYLSAELSVSLPYAPTGTGWEKSMIGHMLSCIAVCEIIDDPSVKCQVKDSDNGPDPSRARAPGSLGGDVPEKYYVVRNNDVMRVKYLLVYTSKSTTVNAKTQKWRWVQEHKFMLMMILYIGLLVLIGLYNSKSFRSFLRKQWR